MSGPRLNRSVTRALVVFWPFLSVPRLWYFARAGVPEGEDGFSTVALPLVLGVLRDGLAVALLLLPVQLGHRLAVWRRLPARLGDRAGALLTFALAVLLSGLMVDVEFLRYFGFHSTVTHLSLAAEWEKISSSISFYLDPWTGLLYFGLLPASFVLLSGWLPLEAIARFTRAVKGLIATGVMIALGVAAAFVPVGSPLSANLAENFLIAFVRDAVSSGALGGEGERSIAAILDATPLPHPSLSSPRWRRFDPRYPLVKATDHQLCRLGQMEGEVCGRDEDGDGYPLRTDCNDLEPGIHPEAADLPGNGVDEDCSGLDADPPNVIFVHWEGVRAVNVGSIGYAIPSTPRFDAFARDGLLFSNAYANGTQTRWSLISVYCSTLPRLSNQWIFKHDPDLELLCVPELLRRRGYHTIYVHGGVIGFAGKLPRLSRWFQLRYDRTNDPIRRMRKFNWGAVDHDVFDFAYQMLKRRVDRRPFFLTVATLAVHHPFDVPEPRFAVRDHADVRNQLSNVIRYSDDALGEFLERILGDPEFDNTIVLVASDHGVNWFAPHPQREQSVLWEDLVWVPLALLGGAWNVEPGVIDEVRQLADIGPTLLDRLGIEVPNPFIGDSLLRRSPDREWRAFFATANGGRSAGVRTGRFKFFEHFDTETRSLFDLDADREETVDLSGDPRQASRVEELSRLVRDLYRVNEQLIEENRIWSERYWLDGEAVR